MREWYAKRMRSAMQPDRSAPGNPFDIGLVQGISGYDAVVQNNSGLTRGLNKEAWEKVCFMLTTRHDLLPKPQVFWIGGGRGKVIQYLESFIGAGWWARVSMVDGLRRWRRLMLSTKIKRLFFACRQLSANGWEISPHSCRFRARAATSATSGRHLTPVS